MITLTCSPKLNETKWLEIEHQKYECPCCGAWTFFDVWWVSADVGIAPEGFRRNGWGIPEWENSGHRLFIGEVWECTLCGAVFS